MQRTRSYILTVASILILNSCGHVAIFDKEQCVDEGSLGAHCAHFYSPAARDIGQPDWDNTRFGWFCMDPSDTVEDKKESEELCSIKGVTCDYQAQSRIQEYIHQGFVKAQELKEHAAAARMQLEMARP